MRIVTAEERANWRSGPRPDPAPVPLRGLGDVVAAATSAVGIRPCGGCKARQEALNRLVPFAAPQPDTSVPGKATEAPAAASEPPAAT